MTQAEGLEQKAILVTYGARAWTGEAPDKKAGRAIQEKHGNVAGSTRTIKHLINPAHLKPVNKAFGAIYLHFRENTLPWEDRRGGARLLPGANYDRFLTRHLELVKEAEAEADKFGENFSEYVIEYRPQLNGLYDPANYPAPELIRAEFSINISFSPLPLSPASLTLKFLGRDELDRLRAEIGEKWTQQENAATGDLYKRLAEKVGHMAATLADPEKVFRDSLVNNVAELVNLIPALNFSNDPELAALAEAAGATLAGIDPQTLRDDMKRRGDMATEAGRLLQQITGAGARYIDMS